MRSTEKLSPHRKRSIRTGLGIVVVGGLQTVAFAADPQAAGTRAWAAIGVIAVAALVVVAAYTLRLRAKLSTEIKRRRWTDAELQKFQRVVEHAADLVMITDTRGIIEYVNPAFTRATGYTLEDVRGRTPQLLKSGVQDPQCYTRLWQSALRGDVFHDEFVNRRKDGALYYEDKSVAPLRNDAGAVTHFISTSKDITERRRAEDALRARRDEQAHAARLNLVGEMAARLAHEINQPLTAVVNYAQGCVRRVRAGETDSQRLLAPLEQIVSQAERAAGTIEHMRNLVARHRPRRAASDINRLVAQTAALAAPEARKRGIAVGLDLSDNLPPVRIDEIQIEQVILNLLSNGTEALADADGARHLSLRTSLGAEGVEVAISDTGPGLPEPLAQNPFEPFVTTKPHGIGLGLAISRSIIETYGGRLWVTPNPDRGVTFRFTLPLETPAHEA